MEPKTQLFLNKQMALFHWLRDVSENLGIDAIQPKEDYKYDMFDDLTTGVIFLKILQIVSGHEVEYIANPKTINEKLVNLTEIQSLANTDLNIGIFSELDINQYVNFQFYKKLLADYYEVALKMASKFSDALPPVPKLDRAPQTNKYGGQIFSSDNLVGEAYYANSARLLVSLRMAIRDLACQADPWTGISQLLGKEDVNVQSNGADYSRIVTQAVLPPQLASICNRASVLREENYLLESLAHVLTKRTEENNQYINEHVDSDNSRLFDSKSSTFGKIYRDSLKIKESKQAAQTSKKGKSNLPTDGYDYTVCLCKGLKKANDEQAEIIEKKSTIANFMSNDGNASMSQQIRSPTPQGQNQTTAVIEIEEPKAGLVIQEINHDPEVIATNSAYEVQLSDMKLRMNKSGEQLSKLKNKNIQQATTYAKLSKKAKEIDEDLEKYKQEYKELSKEYKMLRKHCSNVITDYRDCGVSKLDVTKSPKTYKDKQSVEALISKKKEKVNGLRAQLDDLEKKIQDDEVKLDMTSTNTGVLDEAQL